MATYTQADLEVGRFLATVDPPGGKSLIARFCDDMAPESPQAGWNNVLKLTNG